MTAEGGDVKLCAQEALAVQVGTGIDQELGDTGLSGAAPACSGPLAPASQTQDRDNIKIAQRGAYSNICRLSFCYRAAFALESPRRSLASIRAPGEYIRMPPITSRDQPLSELGGSYGW